MKLREKEHTIFTKKGIDNTLVALLADLHFSDAFNEKKYDLIFRSIIDKNPDYIVLAGDNIDLDNVFDDANDKRRFFEILTELSFLAPTIVGFGSHDFTRVEGKNSTFHLSNAWVQETKNMKNVHLLHNHIYEDKKIRFIGYTQSDAYYFEKEVLESKERMVTEVQQNFACEDINEDKFNLLICHSPIFTLEDTLFEQVGFWKNLDLILSGHMHRGLVFNFLDYPFSALAQLIPEQESTMRQWLEHGGLIYPRKNLFPLLARGRVNKQIGEKEISLIIHDGITVFSKTAPIALQKLDGIYSPSVDYIKIKKLS